MFTIKTTTQNQNDLFILGFSSMRRIPYRHIGPNPFGISLNGITKSFRNYLILIQLRVLKSFFVGVWKANIIKGPMRQLSYILIKPILGYSHIVYSPTLIFRLGSQFRRYFIQSQLGISSNPKIILVYLFGR